MPFKSCVFALFLICSVARFAAADSLTIQPSKDNTLIQQTNPATQFSNGQGDLTVGRTNQAAAVSARRGLVAFDVAGSVPAGSTITGVTLTLRDVSGTNGDRTVTLHPLLQSWGEGNSFQDGGTGVAAQDNDATWLYTFFNSANPGASPTWATPGGDFGPASASAVVSDDLGPGQLFSWASSSHPQMIADVQSWLNSPATNFGWLLRGDESAAQTVKRLNSGESITLPNVPPALTIDSVAVPEPSAFLLGTMAALAAALSVTARRRRSLRR